MYVLLCVDQFSVFLNYRFFIAVDWRGVNNFAYVNLEVIGRSTAWGMNLHIMFFKVVY